MVEFRRTLVIYWTVEIKKGKVWLLINKNNKNPCISQFFFLLLHKETKDIMLMQVENKYIRFDWAVKRMLRDKANFAVLEGLVTVLLGEKIVITELLESEGNQETSEAKFNRVDIKAKNEKGEIIIVEVQLSRQLYYLQRMLYGVSKAITEHIQIGNMYDQVKKVYSINIIYFDLGKGSDYLYHGKTVFTGVHTGDNLVVNTKEANEIRMTAPENVFPEYYIIRVNEFNQIATTPIEEWLDYLKNNRIKDDTSTPGLQEAREKLLYMTMSDADAVPTMPTWTTSWCRTTCSILPSWRDLLKVVRKVVRKKKRI